ncbi:zinc finger CCCH domain-containing protein 62-like isoform X2 [Telopea speciosissima]|uniref:zinc finger CCCH domain-containing protein 62-like isoform X2 n=1 Tax=Telopea speciosissima TaxID=54955 RepID=UPI001CC6418B|nr:zinc finger CCCH domain-containing protein 62-like isoform X2 [Telopea speciosissima]
MAGKKGKGKQAVICLSSSESEEEEEEEEEEDDSDVEDEETTSQSCSDEGSDWSDEGSDCSDDEEASSESMEDDDDDEGGSESTKLLDIEASCNRVIHLLKGGTDLQELKLEECKAYLRKHGLRLTGNKAICIQRIQEHWRIKDGNAEKLYPRSSFVITCTGDVCKGDVVLFTQRVYERYDKVTRNGNLLGKRTVAGRVVKESYGAAKQQHTFTVEILWSKGFKRLPPLFPLLVKGRNLYRLKTFRQRWDDEEERSRVLAEKHRRGTAARHLRAMKIAQSANQGSKRRRQSHRRQSHRASSPKRKRIQEFVSSTQTKRRKGIDSRGKAPRLEQAKAKSIGKARIPKSSSRKNLEDRDPQTEYWSQMQYRPKNFQFMGHENRGPCHVSNYKAGPASDAARSIPFRPYTNPMVVPALRHQEYNQRNYGFPAYADSAYQLGVGNINHLVERDSTYIQKPMGAEMYGGQRSGFLRCSMPGCGDLGTDGCVVTSCWRCCRRTGRKCSRHQRNFPPLYF